MYTITRPKYPEADEKARLYTARAIALVLVSSSLEKLIPTLSGNHTFDSEIHNGEWAAIYNSKAAGWQTEWESIIADFNSFTDEINVVREQLEAERDLWIRRQSETITEEVTEL